LRTTTTTWRNSYSKKLVISMVSIHESVKFEQLLKQLIGKKLIDYKFDEQKYFWDLILIFEDGFTLKLGGYDYELLLEKNDHT